MYSSVHTFIHTHKPRAAVGFVLSARPGRAPHNVGMYWAIEFWKQSPQNPQRDSSEAARVSLPGLHTYTRTRMYIPTLLHTYSGKYIDILRDGGKSWKMNEFHCTAKSSRGTQKYKQKILVSLSILF